MEITNEIKAKVFAQYLGQKAITCLRGYSLDEKRTSQFKIGTLKCVDTAMAISQLGILLDEEKKKENLTDFEGGKDCRLILKPLSQITDEDAIEASSIISGASHLSIESRIKQLRDLFSSPNFWVNQTNISGYKWLSCCQYLQSKGYDLPQYLLGGKTLFEAGLAIYE